MSATHLARSLLLELLRQHNGNNNGHLQLSTAWLKKRGWASVGGIQKAKNEALERRLIVKTRQGGLNFGPDFYALTWLPISNFVGLDIGSNQYHRGDYLTMNPICISKDNNPPKIKRSAANRTVKRNRCSAGQSAGVPSGGMAAVLTVPPDGTKTALFCDLSVPPDGNNVVTNSPRVSLPVRIVGVAGRSGKPRGPCDQV